MTSLRVPARATVNGRRRRRRRPGARMINLAQTPDPDPDPRRTFQAFPSISVRAPANPGSKCGIKPAVSKLRSGGSFSDDASTVMERPIGNDRALPACHGRQIR
ncbi:uncharacterized [Tachysurus ichikawai]